MSKKKGASGKGPQVDPIAAQAAIDAATGPQLPEPSPNPTGDVVTMYSPEGEAVDVPRERAQQVFASGQLGFAEGQQIALRDRAGRVVQTDAGNANQVLGADSGYELAGKHELAEAQESAEYSGIGQGAKALAAGAARGLTFGLSDVAASQIGGDGVREELRKLRKHQGVASTVGEIGGALAPVLLTGGAAAPEEAAALGAGRLAAAGTEGAGLASRTIGAVGALPRGVATIGAKVGEAATSLVGEGATGILGRVVQKAVPLAAQGAVEGAFYGAGEEISESALGDHELNAEKLLAAAGHGALLGAAGGAVLGAGEVAARAAGEKAFKLAGEHGLTEFFESFADNRTIKALGASQRDIARLGKTGEQATERMGQIAKTVREYHFEDGEKLFKATSSVEDLAKSTRRALDEQTTKLDSIRREVTQTIDAHPHLAPNTQEFLAKVDQDVLAPLRESNVASVRAKAEKVEREIAMLRERTVPAGLPDEHPLSQIVKNAAEGNEAAQRALEVARAKDPAVAAAFEVKPVTIDELTQMRKDLDSVIYPKTNSGVPPPAPEHQAELLKVRRALEDTIEQSTERAAQEAGKPELYKDLLDAKKKIHDLIPANQMAERWVTRDIGNRAVSPTDYLSGIGSGIAAAAHGVGGLGSLAIGAGASAMHHLVRERSSAFLAHASDKLAQLSAVRRAALEIDTKIEHGVDTFLTRPQSQPQRAPAAVAYLSNRSQSRDSVFEAKRQEVADAQNGGAHFEKLTKFASTIATHAPQTAAAVASAAAKATANLQKMIPAVGDRPGSLQPTFDKPRVPQSEMAKFARYAAAVDKPLSVLDDMKRGHLSREAVQAVRDNYPKIFQQMQRIILEKVAERKTELSYDKRIQLGRLFDVPTDPTLEPAFIASINKMYDETQAKPKEQEGSQKSKGARRPAKQLSGNVMMPAQELMSEAS